MTDLSILLLHRQNSAVGYYRSWVPGRALRALGYEVASFEYQSYHEALRPKAYRSTPRKDWSETWLRERLNHYDLLMTDRAIKDWEVGMFAGYRHYSRGCRMIVDMDDDFTCIPAWNHSRASYQPGSEAHQSSLNHFRCSEMLTVSTQTLKDRFENKAHCSRVLPNRIDPADWENLPADPSRASDDHVRVLYGGAMGHYGDLDEAKEALKGLLRNPPVPWRLICFGTVPNWIHDLSRELPGKVLRLPWVHFRDYPQAIAWGGFDIALAPLKDHPFNYAKSNIKWLESSLQDMAFLCSDVGPYADIPAGCALKVRNTPAAWAEGLRNLLTDRALRKQFARTAQSAVRDEWTIDKGRETLQSIVEEAMSRPRIETVADTRLPQDEIPEPVGISDANR